MSSQKQEAHEWNCDAVVGPSHHFAGLSVGNQASMIHKASVSHPKKAALDSLHKMKKLHDLGLKQLVLPPQHRPRLDLLHTLGFSGSKAQMLDQAFRTSPSLLSALYSSSAMWTANAATVTPSSDSADGKFHITPANLVSTFHRSLESQETARILKTLLNNQNHFCHHDPLPPGLPDEGAANHVRLTHQHAQPGIHLFVYGKTESDTRPHRYPRRQSQEASKVIARSHGLSEDQVIFAKQNSKAIDAGVFHNDVICTGNGSILMCHENAFESQDKILDEIQQKFGKGLTLIQISEKDLPLKKAISSYFFNAQLLTLPHQKQLMLLPSECEGDPHIANIVAKLHASIPGEFQVQFVTVRESMKNGGGPACLRLRMVFNTEEEKHLHQAYVFSDTLYKKLCACIQATYPDSLQIETLRDLNFVKQCENSIQEIHNLFR